MLFRFGPGPAYSWPAGIYFGMASVMLLCAGFGLRLRPLTLELPKPLVPVGDRALLSHLLERVRNAGFESAVINVHHLAELFVRIQDKLPLPVDLVQEPVIRGTAGGVAGARSLLRTLPVIVWNADAWGDPPLAELARFAGEGLCLLVKPRPAGQGTVGLDAQGRVVRLRREWFGTEIRGADYVGVAALGPRCLEQLPESGCLIGDWALPELRRGGRVETMVAEGAWIDVGEPQGYLLANLTWLEQSRLQCWVGPEARIAPEIEVAQSVIGERAVVEGRGTITRSVLWPGSRAMAPLSNAVVTGSGHRLEVPA